MSSPDKEIVQIVDTCNRPVAQVPRHIMRRDGLIHRASYILVFNRVGHLFVQKRTIIKDVFPGYWDVAAGGVVLGTESYEQSAYRELQEELGVEDTRLTFLFDHYYADQQNKVWGYVYSCCSDGPFILQKEEIDEGKFLSIDEILRLQQSEPFTPDGIEIVKRYQNLKKTII